MSGRTSRDDAAFLVEGKVLRELEASVPPSECTWSVDAGGAWRARRKGYAEFRFVNGFVFRAYCGDWLRQMDTEPFANGRLDEEERPHDGGH